MDKFDSYIITLIRVGTPLEKISEKYAISIEELEEMKENS